MSHDTNVLDAVVKSLESRLDESEKRIASISDELREWKSRSHAHCSTCGHRSAQKKKYLEKPFSDLPLSEAAFMCLVEYTHPINVRTLRMRLEERGYPTAKMGRYGNYLHTVICRLIEAGRIQRLEGDEIIAV